MADGIWQTPALTSGACSVSKAGNCQGLTETNVVAFKRCVLADLSFLSAMIFHINACVSFVVFDGQIKSNWSLVGHLLRVITG